MHLYFRMMRVLLSVSLFLVPFYLYFSLFSRNDKKAISARTVASASSARAIKANSSASSVNPNKIIENVKVLPQTEIKREKTWAETFSEIQGKLHPETLQWAQKLPAPRNLAEEKIYLRLQLVYQVRGISDISSFLPDLGGSPITESTKDYVDDCIWTLDARDDYRERTFMIMFSQHKNSNRDLTKAIFDQVDVLFSETDRYDPGYFVDVSNIVRNSANIEKADKEEILWQIKKRRNDMEEQLNRKYL